MKEKGEFDDEASNNSPFDVKLVRSASFSNQPFDR